MRTRRGRVMPRFAVQAAVDKTGFEIWPAARLCLATLLATQLTLVDKNSHTYHDKESPRRPPCPRRQRIRRSAVRLERAHQVEPSGRNGRFRRRRRRSRGRLWSVNVRRGQRRREQLSPPFLRLFLQLALRGQVIVTAATSLNAGEADDAMPRRRRRTPGERRGKELRRQAPDAVAAQWSLQTGPRRRVVHLCVVHLLRACSAVCKAGSLLYYTARDRTCRGSASHSVVALPEHHGAAITPATRPYTQTDLIGS